MLIVAFYASVLAILFVALSVRTIGLRRRFRIGIGDGGNAHLLRAMRVHSNFSEYVPFALFMMLMISQMADAWFVHLLGILLLCGRLLHAFGVSQVQENFNLRKTGIAMTFSMLLISAGYLLYQCVVQFYSGF